MHGRWRSLVALTLARAAMAFQFQSVAAVAPLLIDDLGLDKAQLGWLIGLYLLPGIAFALPGGLLGRRFGDKRLVLVGLALMGLGGIWFASADSFAAANAARILSGTGAVMLNVLMTKMVADWFDGKERLLAMSILINAWPVGIGIALLVVPHLGEMGGWPWGIGSTAVFAAIGFAIVGVVYRSPGTLSYRPVGSLGLGGMSPRESQLLLIASLPWMLYNAAVRLLRRAGSALDGGRHGALLRTRHLAFPSGNHIRENPSPRIFEPDRLLAHLCHFSAPFRQNRP